MEDGIEAGAAPIDSGMEVGWLKGEGCEVGKGGAMGKLGASGV
ncbi:MAG: hypothetical protein U1F57_06650 [bacterium]